MTMLPEYLDAMRMLGPDLEELMVMEAMRLSLQESENASLARPPTSVESDEDEDRVLAELIHQGSEQGDYQDPHSQ